MQAYFKTPDLLGLLSPKSKSSSLLLYSFQPQITVSVWQDGDRRLFGGGVLSADVPGLGSGKEECVGLGWRSVLTPELAGCSSSAGVPPLLCNRHGISAASPCSALHCGPPPVSALVCSASPACIALGGLRGISPSTSHSRWSHWSMVQRVWTVPRCPGLTEPCCPLACGFEVSTLCLQSDLSNPGCHSPRGAGSHQ